MKEKFKKVAIIATFCLFIYILGDGVLCQSKAILGIPCPGCGLTRAFLALFKGEFKQAFFYHPLWPIIISVVFLLIFKKNVLKNQNLLIIIIGLFLVVYIIRMILFFPHTSPMDFNNNGFMPKIINIFK